MAVDGGARNEAGGVGGWLSRRGQQGGRQASGIRDGRMILSGEGSGGPAQPGWDRHLAALYRTGLVRTSTEK